MLEQDEVITTRNFEVMNAIIERVEKVYGVTLKVHSDNGTYTVTIPASIYLENKTFSNPFSRVAFEQACEDWLSNKAYIDGNGNYHVKREGKASGPIAVWNRAVKANFNSVTHFHFYARYQAKKTVRS